MNKQHNTTAPAAPAMPDMQAAFLGLEELIDRVRRPVNTLDLLISRFDETERDRHGMRHVEKVEVDAWYDTSLTAREAVRALEDRWGEAHSALARYELYAAAHGASPSKDLGVADPLLDLVRAYEAGMAAYKGLDDDEPAAIAATYGPPYDALLAHTVPAPTTKQGALAALRLLMEEGKGHLDGQMVASVLPVVIGFLEREAA